MARDVCGFLQNCKNMRLKMNAESMLQLLWGNYLLGVNVPKRQIPRSYLPRLGHKHNLYLLDLVEGWRMIYTLSACSVHNGIRVDVVEILSHPEYMKRFGY